MSIFRGFGLAVSTSGISRYIAISVRLGPRLRRFGISRFMDSVTS